MAELYLVVKVSYSEELPSELGFTPLLSKKKFKLSIK